MPSVLDLFCPPVVCWFQERYGSATPPQELGWPRTVRGENVLILTPTGSGKTLAAFLYTINELVTRRAEEQMPVRDVHAVYVSPLRALVAGLSSRSKRGRRGSSPRRTSRPGHGGRPSWFASYVAPDSVPRLGWRRGTARPLWRVKSPPTWQPSASSAMIRPWFCIEASEVRRDG